MTESSEINKYHNKDIIDRLEALECKWEGLPDIQMYTDFIIKYNEIKNLLFYYLRKDINDTVSSVITFQQMPIIPDTSGNSEDIIKKKYIDDILKNYVNKTEDQILNNDFTFKGVTTFHNAAYFESKTVIDKTLSVIGDSYFKNYPCISESLLAPTKNEELVNKKYVDDQIKEHIPEDIARLNQFNAFTDVNIFRNITRFYNKAIVVSRFTPDTGRLLQLADILDGEYKFPKPTTYVENNLVYSDYINEYYFRNNAFLINSDELQLIQSPCTFKTYPCVSENLPDPTKDIELVTKKYVDDQVEEHVYPENLARKDENNIFTAINTFYDRTFIQNELIIMSKPDSAAEIKQQGLYSSSDDEYTFINPQTVHNDDIAYSNYINEYYYRQHTLLKDSPEKQSVSSIVDFTNNILIKGKQIEALTSEHVRLLEILKEMIGDEDQLRFKNNIIIANVNPERHLYTYNKDNFSYSDTIYTQGYFTGLSSSVLGGIYRMSYSYPRYEFLGVLQEVKDDLDKGLYKDTVHLMTYSSLSDRLIPPMYSSGIGMWISGVACNGLWNNRSEQLESVESVLGYVKPERDISIYDDILNIQPVFSKVTCSNIYYTTYEAGLLYGKGYLWNDNTTDKNVIVTKYALYSKGLTTHPQKTLSNSDFDAIFGYLEWASNDSLIPKLIHYEASSVSLPENDIDLNSDKQNFRITSKNGFIKWESPTYTGQNYEKELSLEGSHSINNYDFTHGLYNDQPGTNYSDLKIYKSLNEYNLSIFQRQNHEKWDPIKIIGFNSSISLNHKDTGGSKELVTSLENKIGYHAGLYNEELADYSRSLLRSSYSESHFCDNLDKIILRDKIEIGNYSSNLTTPQIQYFNTLQNTFNTTSSYVENKNLLTRTAFAGYITGYKASTYHPLFATIKWEGYPYSVYSHHSNSDMYSLYFYNHSPDTTDNSEIASILTFYNYNPLIEYGTRLNYQYNQGKFIYSVLPDPSNHDIPIINTEIYAATSTLNGSKIELNARTITVPNIEIPTDIKEISDITAVNGKIIKKVIENTDNTVAILQDKVDDDLRYIKGEIGMHSSSINSLYREIDQCPILSTIFKPTETARKGTLLLWSESSILPTISMRSPNWAPGTIPTGATGEIIVTGEDASPRSAAYIDFKITDNASTAKHTATLRLSSTVYWYTPELNGYLQFFDCSNIPHLVAAYNTIDAIRYHDEDSKEEIVPLPHFILEKHQNRYKLILRDDNNTNLAFVEFSSY